jgi:hypothetical protein
LKIVPPAGAVNTFLTIADGDERLMLQSLMNDGSKSRRDLGVPFSVKAGFLKFPDKEKSPPGFVPVKHPWIWH